MILFNYNLNCLQEHSARGISKLYTSLKSYRIDVFRMTLGLSKQGKLLLELSRKICPWLLCPA